MSNLFDQGEQIEIFVEGVPKTKGSLTGICLNAIDVARAGVGANGKPRVRPRIAMSETSTKKARRERRQWRKTLEDAIAWEWQEKVGAKIPEHVPVEVHLLYLFRRPKSVKPSKRRRPTAKLDIDKLERMVLDCMTKAGVYHDDGQVCKVTHEKDYALETSATGVRIRISSF